MVERVLTRLQEDYCRVLPVLAGGELAGILTTENLGEYLMVQAALGESPHGKRVRHRQPMVISSPSRWV